MTADPHWKGIALDGAAALALLEWQRDMGVDEPMLDEPVDRYAEPIRDPAPAQAKTPPPTHTKDAAPSRSDGPDFSVQARDLAGRADTLEALASIMEAFDGLEIKRGAHRFVFADGNPKARVMIIGEAPGEDEDKQGRPFVGRAGKLLDQMFGAIGLSRDAVDAEKSLYITNVLNWRPPGNRTPEPHEIDIMRPFITRHVELIAPDMIVLMGNSACQAALQKTGVMRLRGTWTQAFGRAALPMTHPSYLLRKPEAKRDAWADLLSLNARLRGPAQP